MADLTIVVDVRDDQTMSSYRIPNSDKLTYKNASTTDPLVITPKAGNTTLPICEDNQTTPIPTPLTIPADGSVTVRICKDFNGPEFLYTAQIGAATAEDPIVIVEKKAKFVLDPWTAGIFGLLVGAGITYFIVRLRDSRRRPQQG